MIQLHLLSTNNSVKDITKKGLDYLLSNKSQNIVDVLMEQKNMKIVSSDVLVEDVQKRVYLALKQKQQYSDVAKDSDEFLRKNVFSSKSMVVMYVDLVGSTQMVLDLPQKQLAIIVSSFAQEMAYVIRHQNGHVLKFVGDAVIGYFVKDDTSHIADRSVSCAESMLKVLKMGINPVLKQYDYPDLAIKIGIDFGENSIIRYGDNEQESHVDLLGPSMNMAAKIQTHAQPDQILIGGEVYKKLDPDIQKYFEQMNWKENQWNYRNKISGKIYSVYAYVGK